MNNRPLYENLDTAFVNLAALVKYLRHREFVGRIRVELNNYEADIVLYERGKISVREFDKISGRVSEGEEAFQILLIRAREAGGTIHVYQTVKEEQPAIVEEVKVVEIPKVETPKAKPIAKASPTIKMNGQTASTPKVTEVVQAATASTTQNGTGKVVKVTEISKKTEPAAKLPKFPFDLHNKVEAKARQNKLSAEDWQILVSLTGELLGTIDKSLAVGKLDFKSAFAKARTEISEDYPFLHPSGKIFDYGKGKFIMHEQVNAKVFITGIVESLRRILDKLGANSKFTEIHRNTTQKILALINQRKNYYDKFSFTLPLKKILGV